MLIYNIYNNVKITKNKLVVNKTIIYAIELLPILPIEL